MNRLQRFLLHPIVLMVLACWGSYLIWLLTSASFLEAEGMIKADAATGALVALMSSGCFVLGCFIQRVFFRKSQPDLTVEVVPLRHDCMMGLVATISLLVILVVMLIANGGAGAIAESIAGNLKGATVPGVTTLVHIGTALPPLGTGMAILLWSSGHRRWSRSFLLIALASLLVGGFRAYLTAERISLLVPVLASFIVIAAMLRRNVVRRILTFAIVIPLFLAFYFIASESIRSFQVKSAGGKLEENVWEYTSARLLLYYVTAVNGGIAEYRLLPDKGLATPVFDNTLNPLSQVLGIVGVQISIEGKPSPGRTKALIEEQYRLAEFTNTWGFSTPWSEGHLVGAAFWILWGAISTWLYRRMCASGSPLDIAPYAIAAVGLFDSSRVLLLGAVHCLVPLIYLLFLRIRNGHRVRDTRGAERLSASQGSELEGIR